MLLITVKCCLRLQKNDQIEGLTKNMDIYHQHIVLFIQIMWYEIVTYFGKFVLKKTNM